MLKLHREILVLATERDVWNTLGEQFGSIADWAAPITSSSLDMAPAIGAIRTCKIRAFGPVPAGVIKERLTAFDRSARTFTYEAAGGLPAFINKASNQWTVVARDAHSCVVHSNASVELKGVMKLFGFALSWRMRSDGYRVLEELKHWVEHGAAHPRKLASQ